MTLKKNKRTRKKRGGTPMIHAKHKSNKTKPKTFGQLLREKQWKTQNMANIDSREIERTKDSIKNKFCEYCSYARGDIIDFNVYYFEANNIEKKDRYDENNYVKFFDFKEDMLLNNKQHKWMSYLKKYNQKILSLYQKWKGYYDRGDLIDDDGKGKKTYNSGSVYVGEAKEVEEKVKEERVTIDKRKARKKAAEAKEVEEKVKEEVTKDLKKCKGKKCKSLEDWINKYTENIIHMKQEHYSKNGGWTLPFTMKIPNANIDAFLGKKTLEQLLEHIGKGNEPDATEKRALKKFYETNRGKNKLNDLKKKSTMKCKFSTFTGCKGKKDRAGKAFTMIKKLLGEGGVQTSDVEVKVDENPPTADTGGRRKKRTRRRKKRTRRRKKRKRKKTRKRRKRRR